MKDEKIELTKDEVVKFTEAFKDDKFKKLFFEYLNELQTDENARDVYSQQLSAVESLITPHFKFLLKSSKGKYINICESEKIKKIEMEKTQKKGVSGMDVKLPYSCGKMRTEDDGSVVWDIVFNPQTIEKAESNARIMKMLIETSYEAVGAKEEVWDVVIEGGKPKGKIANTIIKDGNEVKHDDTPSKNTKNATSSPLPKKDIKYVPPKQTLKKKSAKKTVEEPVFKILHQTLHTDFQKFIGNKKSTRPDALKVVVSLPKIKSASEVDLDLTQETFHLEVKDLYKLDCKLPYIVDATEGSSAEFDLKTKTLSVTCKVIQEPEPPLVDYATLEPEVKTETSDVNLSEDLNKLMNDISLDESKEGDQLTPNMPGKIANETSNASKNTRNITNQNHPKLDKVVSGAGEAEISDEPKNNEIPQIIDATIVDNKRLNEAVKDSISEVLTSTASSSISDDQVSELIKDVQEMKLMKNSSEITIVPENERETRSTNSITPNVTAHQNNETLSLVIQFPDHLKKAYMSFEDQKEIICSDSDGDGKLFDTLQIPKLENMKLKFNNKFTNFKSSPSNVTWESFFINDSENVFLTMSNVSEFLDPLRVSGDSANGTLNVVKAVKNSEIALIETEFVPCENKTASCSGGDGPSVKKLNEKKQFVNSLIFDLD